MARKDGISTRIRNEIVVPPVERVRSVAVVSRTGDREVTVLVFDARLCVCWAL
jgi:hypothetical protein